MNLLSNYEKSAMKIIVFHPFLNFDSLNSLFSRYNDEWVKTIISHRRGEF